MRLPVPLRLLPAFLAAALSGCADGSLVPPGGVPIRMDPEAVATPVGGYVQLEGAFLTELPRRPVVVRWASGDESVLSVDSTWSFREAQVYLAYALGRVTGLGQTAVTLRVYDESGRVQVGEASVPVRVEWAFGRFPADSAQDGTGPVIRAPRSGRLLAAPYLDGRVFASSDGQTWERLTGADGIAPGFWVHHLYVSPADERHLYALGAVGAHDPDAAYGSDDGGATWHPIALPVLSALSAHFHLAPHPTEPRTLFLIMRTSSQSSVHRSDDGGATWIPLATFPESADIPALYVDPSRPSRLYVWLSYTSRRSDDGGQTWIVLAESEGSAVRIVAVDGHGHLFGTTYRSGRHRLVRSADGGATWEPLLEHEQARHLLTVTTGPTGVLLAYRDGDALCISQDEGATWPCTDLLPWLGETERMFLLRPSPLELVVRVDPWQAPGAGLWFHRQLP